MLLGCGRGCSVSNTELKSLGATIFGVPPESITASESIAAKVAFVIARLEMHLENVSLRYEQDCVEKLTLSWCLSRSVFR